MFDILPIPGHRYATKMEYDDSRSLTVYTLYDLTLGLETWGTYMLYWDDNLKSFGASEEQHIIKSCYDTECDNIDIQPWSIFGQSGK
jgi:hypothetical protein